MIVQGALTTHSWESENGRRSKPRIKAFAVGPNLARGMADVQAGPVRPRRRAGRRRRERTPPAPDDAPRTSSRPTPRTCVAGRDYVGDDETLHEVNPADLSAEPAHV